MDFTLQCRACLSKSEDMYPIFEVTDGVILANILGAFQELDIKEDDSFPKAMCKECANIVFRFQQLKTMVLRSQEYMKTVLQFKMCVELKTPIKEEVIPTLESKVSIPVKEEFTPAKPLLEAKLESKEETPSDDLPPPTQPESCSEMQYQINYDFSGVNEAEVQEEGDALLDNVNFDDIGDIEEDIKSLEEDSGDEHIEETNKNVNKFSASHSNSDVNTKENKPNSDHDEEMQYEEDIQSNYTEPPNLSEEEAVSEDESIVEIHESETDSVPSDEATNHQQKRIVCSMCNASVPNEAMLNVHYKTKHSELVSQSETPKVDSLKCSICHKVLKDAKALKDHIIEHLTCDVCGFVATNTSYLIQHISIVHLKDYKFQCTECDRKFKSRAEFIQHKKTHNDTYAHKCNVCDKKFKFRYSLMNHVKKVHAKPRFTNRNFECHICNKLFALEKYLRQHVLRFHRPKSPVASASTKREKPVINVPLPVPPLIQCHEKRIATDIVKQPVNRTLGMYRETPQNEPKFFAKQENVLVKLAKTPQIKKNHDIPLLSPLQPPRITPKRQEKSKITIPQYEPISDFEEESPKRGHKTAAEKKLNIISNTLINANGKVLTFADIVAETQESRNVINVISNELISLPSVGSNTLSDGVTTFVPNTVSVVGTAFEPNTLSAAGTSFVPTASLTADMTSFAPTSASGTTYVPISHSTPFVTTSLADATTTFVPTLSAVAPETNFVATSLPSIETTFVATLPPSGETYVTTTVPTTEATFVQTAHPATEETFVTPVSEEEANRGMSDLSDSILEFGVSKIDFEDLKFADSSFENNVTIPLTEARSDVPEPLLTPTDPITNYVESTGSTPKSTLKEVLASPKGKERNSKKKKSPKKRSTTPVDVSKVLEGKFLKVVINKQDIKVAGDHLAKRNSEESINNNVAPHNDGKATSSNKYGMEIDIEDVLPSTILERTSEDTKVPKTKKQEESDANSMDTVCSNESNKSKNMLYCFLCNMKFSENELLTKHYDMHHPVHNVEDSVTIYQQEEEESEIIPVKAKTLVVCTECGATFEKTNDLDDHIARAHRKEPHYACRTCGMPFKSINLLNAHQQAHEDSRKFTCEICRKSFNYKSILATHIKQEHATSPTKHNNDKSTENKMPCSYCDLIFDNQKECIEHIHKSHLGYRKLCEICHKTYANATGLKKHMLTHAKNTNQKAC